MSQIRENLTPQILKQALQSEKATMLLHGLMRRLGNDILQVAKTCSQIQESFESLEQTSHCNPLLSPSAINELQTDQHNLGLDNLDQNVND